MDGYSYSRCLGLCAPQERRRTKARRGSFVAGLFPECRGHRRRRADGDDHLLRSMRLGDVLLTFENEICHIRNDPEPGWGENWRRVVPSVSISRRGRLWPSSDKNVRQARHATGPRRHTFSSSLPRPAQELAAKERVPAPSTPRFFPGTRICSKPIEVFDVAKQFSAAGRRRRRSTSPKGGDVRSNLQSLIHAQATWKAGPVR